MQIDMHYYGVCAMARLAGLIPEAASTIATASQYETFAHPDKNCQDDSNKIAE